MDSAIQAMCRAVADYGAATWQRIPIGVALNEPLPIRATLERFRFGSIQEQRNCPSGWAAIEEALCSWPRVPAIVMAEAGFGKSVVMRWAAHELARRALTEEVSGPLPIHIDLGEHFGNGACTSLADVVRAHIAHRAPTIACVPRILALPRIVLLDGLDLIREPLRPEVVIHQAYGLAADPHVQVVIACRRNDVLVADLRELAESVRITLGGLDHEAQRAWLKKVHHDSILIRELQKTPPDEIASSILSIPMYFAIAVAQSRDAHSKPSLRPTIHYPSRTGFLDSYVLHAVHQACVARRLPAGTNLYEHSCELERVCLTAAMRGFHDRIPFQELEDLLRAARAKGLARWKQGCRIATAAGLLFSRSSSGEYVFLHQQFAEYFAARELVRRLIHAADNGFFEAELFNFLHSCVLDGITAQACAILSTRKETRCLLTRALDLLHDADPRAMHRFAGQIDPDVAYQWAEGKMRTTGDHEVFRWLIQAMGAIGSPTAHEALRRIASDAALPAVHHFEAVEQLSTHTPAGRAAAIRLLMEWVEDRHRDEEKASRAICELGALRATDSAPLLESIVSEKAESPRLWRDAVNALMDVDSQKALRALKRLEQEPGGREFFLRMNFAIPNRIEDAPLRELIHLSSDSNAPSDQRLAAMHALERHGGTRSAVALVRVVRRSQNDELLRGEAIQAAWRLDKTRTTRLLTHLLYSPSEPWYLRMTALDLLSATSGVLNPSRLERLCLSSSDEDKLRVAAFHSLCRMDLVYGTKTANRLMRDLSAPAGLRECALEQLLAAQAAVDTELITAIARSHEPEGLRRTAVRALAARGGIPAVESLRAIAEDPDDTLGMRCDAVRALARLDPQGAEHILLDMFRRNTQADPNTLCTAADIGATRSVPLLEAVARDPATSDVCRHSAVQAMIQLDRRRAIPTAVYLCAGDSSPMLLAGLTSLLAGLGQHDEDSWNAIRTEARRYRPNHKWLVRLALRAHRRVLPAKQEMLVNRQWERRSSPTSPNERSPLFEDSDPEVVMTAYLRFCQTHERTVSLRDAEAWAKAHGRTRGVSKSSLRKTKVYQLYLSEKHSRRKYHREQEHRRLSGRPRDDDT